MQECGLPEPAVSCQAPRFQSDGIKQAPSEGWGPKLSLAAQPYAAGPRLTPTVWYQQALGFYASFLRRSGERCLECGCHGADICVQCPSHFRPLSASPPHRNMNPFTPPTRLLKLLHDVYYSNNGYSRNLDRFPGCFPAGTDSMASRAGMRELHLPTSVSL